MARTQGGGARDELSRALRALRDVSAVSQVVAGRETGIGQRAISRFEAGLYTPAPGELATLLRFYRADDDTTGRLLAIAEARIAEPRPPRFIARPGYVAAIQHRTRLLEQRAAVIEAFQPSGVVGLVQAREYIEAVFGQPGVEDAAEAIAERLLRQREVVDSDRHVVVVHTEGALRNHLCSPKVMAAQLDKLTLLASAPSNVRVGIIPWVRPVDRPLMSGFRLYDRKTLAVSSETGELFPPDPTVIAEAAAAFDDIVEWADFGETAAGHYERIAGEYRRLR